MVTLRVIHRALLVTAAVLLVAPVATLSAMYLIGPSSVPAPVLPLSDVPELPRNALWVALGERRGETQDPVWRSLFWNGQSNSAPRGALAVSELARLWRLEHRTMPLRMWEWHIEGAALTVWLRRHATAAQMQQALAEWEYFGREARGIRAASIAYFGTTPESLSNAQVALLAGLPAAPTFYDPFCHPERAQKRRAYVLSRMQASGLISDVQVEQANSEALQVRPPVQPCPNSPR